VGELNQQRGVNNNLDQRSAGPRHLMGDNQESVKISSHFSDSNLTDTRLGVL
jgi:hypothetical protein